MFALAFRRSARLFTRSTSTRDRSSMTIFTARQSSPVRHDKTPIHGGIPSLKFENCDGTDFAAPGRESELRIPFTILLHNNTKVVPCSLLIIFFVALSMCTRGMRTHTHTAFSTRVRNRDDQMLQAQDSFTRVRTVSERCENGL